MFQRPSPRISVTGLLLAALLAGQAAQAAVLARYEFSNSLASNDDDVANLYSTASDFSDGPGFTSGYFTYNTTNVARSVTVNQTNSTTEAGANGAGTAGDYFMFTITPAAGQQINLASITMDFAASYNTAYRGFGIRTSVDNYASLVGVVDEPASSGTSNVFVNRSVDLSIPSLQGITTAITFRITVYDNATVSTNADRFDNVIVNGTVPEPATAVLAALTGCLSLCARRRKAA